MGGRKPPRGMVKEEILVDILFPSIVIAWLLPDPYNQVLFLTALLFALWCYFRATRP